MDEGGFYNGGCGAGSGRPWTMNTGMGSLPTCRRPCALAFTQALEREATFFRLPI
jgi:hypothetical protein